mgnify:CR=1 FL=1
MDITYQKGKIMEKNNSDFRRIFKIVFCAVLLFWISNNLSLIAGIFGKTFDILLPFIIGGCIAFIINIPMAAIEKKMLRPRKSKKNGTEKQPNKKLARFFAMLFSIIFIIAILLAIFKLIVPELINVVQLLIEKIPYLAEKAQIFIQNNTEASNLIQEIFTKLQETELSFEEEVLKFVSNILNSSISLVGSVVGFITNLVISIIFAGYILMSKEKLGNQFDKLFKAYLNTKWYQRISKFLRISKRTFSTFITVQAFEATLLGILCIIGMLIFNIPYAITVGVFIGVTALVPVVGAFLGIFVGALLILAVEPLKVLPFIVLVLVLQQIEGNLIYPKVVGDAIGLPGIWVLAAVSIGGSLAGILGMLIGVPVASVIYTLVKEDVNSKISN